MANFGQLTAEIGSGVVQGMELQNLRRWRHLYSAITLGIGPHSSFYYFMVLNCCSLVHDISPGVVGMMMMMMMMTRRPAAAADIERVMKCRDDKSRR